MVKYKQLENKKKVVVNMKNRELINLKIKEIEKKI